MQKNLARKIAVGMMLGTACFSTGCKTGAWGSSGAASSSWLSWANPWSHSTWGSSNQAKIPTPPSSTATPTATNSLAAKSNAAVADHYAAAPTAPAGPTSYPQTAAAPVGYGAQTTPYPAQPVAYQAQTPPAAGGYQTGPYNTGAPGAQPAGYPAAAPANPYQAWPAQADPNAQPAGGYAPPAAGGYQQAPPGGYAPPPTNAYPQGGGYPTQGGAYPTQGGAYPAQSDAGNPAEAAASIAAHDPGARSPATASAYDVRPASAEQPVTEQYNAVQPTVHEAPAASPAPAASVDRPGVLGNTSLPPSLASPTGYRPGSTGTAPVGTGDTGRFWR